MTDNGRIIVLTDNLNEARPPAPQGSGGRQQPTEHPVCSFIRDALSALADDLGTFEQTTHGVIGPGSIESVAHALVECYERPSAYAISDLSQCIRHLLKESKP